MNEQRPGSEVVVGVDHSPSAQAALNWAADYARGVGFRLRAIHVLHDKKSPVRWTPGVPGMAYLAESPSTANTTATMRLIFGQVHPDPGWVLEFENGPIGPVLVERSRHAAALVLGTRHHVGIERLLVGSVSHHCLTHAGCPVVAVPAAAVNDGTSARTAGRAQARPTVNRMTGDPRSRARRH